MGGLNAGKTVLEGSKRVWLAGACIRGSLHDQNDLPCQDAFECGQLADGSVVIAVADGLGSAVRADVGARLAVRSAIDEAASSASNKNAKSLCRDAAAAARRRLEALALELDCPIGELATTLIVVWVGEQSVATAHLGDGAVVCDVDGQLALVSAPEETEYVNVVMPLTSDQWESSLRVSQIERAVRSVAIFTDGCQRAALGGSGSTRQPHSGFFKPLFEFAADRPPEQEACIELTNLLQSPKLAAASDDDKTLVIAALAGEVRHAGTNGI